MGEVIDKKKKASDIPNGKRRDDMLVPISKTEQDVTEKPKT